MSKPIFSDPFVFRGVRRNRQSFLQSISFQALCGAAIWFAADTLLGGDWSTIGQVDAAPTDISVGSFTLAVLLALATVPLLLLHLSAGTQRCRDCGMTGWAALALLVPPLNIPMLIALCLCRGQDGANKYGESPLRRAEVASRFDALLEIRAIEE